MELKHKEITQVLGLYEKYCRIMHIETRPVLTLNIEEYRQALKDIHTLTEKHNDRYLSKLYGQCAHKRDNTVNDIIYLNSPKFAKLLGLHELEKEPIIIKKRKYTYSVYKSIGHLEETLIHELLHVKYPKLRHGKMFKQYIKYYYNKGNKYISEITQ